MQNSSLPVIVTVAAISIILLFLGFLFIIMLVYYRNKRQQTTREKEMMQQAFNNQLLQSQIETQEETFSALGKELHDNIGQLLNSTKLLIGVSQRTLVQYPDTLSIADDTLGKAIQELRSLSKSLNKEWLQQFNFMENLATEVKRINAADILQVHLLAQAAIPCTNDEQLILFRIVQEALQNAIKHAHASNIHITLSDDAAFFTIRIADDGSGFIENEKGVGVGVLNMQQRIQLLGGRIAWQSNNKGTTVSIYLPIKPMQA